MKKPVKSGQSMKTKTRAKKHRTKKSSNVVSVAAGKVSPDSAVQIKTSRFPLAGEGLFATRSFLRGALLPKPYLGRRLTLLDSTLHAGKYGDDYIMFVHSKGDGLAIDGRFLMLGNPLRYVNGAASPAQLKKVNVEMWRRRGKPNELWYRTTRDVDAEEEFVVDYGLNYWEGKLAPRSHAALVKAHSGNH